MLKEDIDQALEVLKNGGIILYPTDTIWGIGCDATNAEAVDRISALKQRADRKSFIILLDQPGRLNAYVKDVPDIGYDLIDLSNKPLTLVFDGAKNLPGNLIAEDGSIGIRITGEFFSKTLCARLRKPLVSTSANVSGDPAPSVFGEIDKTILDGVDYIVKYRQDEITPGKPSGIIKLGTGGTVKVIRE